MDFANHPGLLFVVATLLPLVSFTLLLILFGVRAGLRKSEEDTAGRSLYEALGGDTPRQWPAWVATGAIALAFVFSLTGFIWYTAEASSHEAEVKRLEEELFLLDDDLAHASKEERPAVEKKVDAKEAELAAVKGRWSGQLTWVRLTLPGLSDPEKAVALHLGYYIDSLSAIMFVMVTLIATLIHLFSIGYMSDELQRTVEDHQVHTEEGHLHRRGRFGRFFLFLSLFCFSMLNLVLANNLFQVFVSWELVGVCSYLLVGFYFERQSASNAANKAFIVNRVGDVGFIIGLMIVWTYLGTFNFEGMFSRVRAPMKYAHGGEFAGAGKFVRADVAEDREGFAADGKPLVLNENGSELVLWPRKPHHFTAPGETFFSADDPSPGQTSSMPYWLLVIGGLGIFLGCVGKSAQFPLHVWLPDAMEGPTPVSALIHAATMVAAGVYLVGRCYPLFTAEVLLTIAYTGAITLFVAATIAVVMTDIKKVLAYSTVSQLGYMMLALGIGGWVAGLFHLLTHAFFKALLFLCSGSVIYGCHHEQDMLRMGGLYPKMKITALTMLIGTLAICGIPSFSGWYSKDAIIATSLGFAYVNPTHALLFVLPLLTAGLTTFYMFRMWLMTFTGRPRDHHVYEHAHESPRLMTVPLIVLAFFSVVVAWGWPFFSTHFPFVNAEASWLEHQIHHAQPTSVLADFGSLAELREEWEGASPVPPVATTVRGNAYVFHALAGNLALLVVAVGMVFAFALYYYRALDPAEAKEQFPAAHRFLSRKWYFDELYSVALVRPALVLAHWCKAIDTKGIDWLIDNSALATVKVSKWDGRFDNKVIDGLVNLCATVAWGIGGWFRRWQTGYLRSYVLFLVMAAMGIYVVLTLFLTRA